ncbi:hypothetical protein G6F61_003147 [Rhizopus arrhizus]|nr:hypothetical protein G6F66_003238 [Rhizopus arrhizus]KAG1381453.1 hypothetical protein G6F61_003147 [Rhizopus arrhizus]
MAEEDVDIYGDYDFSLGDDLGEIVHDVPMKKRSRSEEPVDEKQTKSLKSNEDPIEASQKIQTTTQAYQSHKQQQQQQQNYHHHHQQQQIPTSLTQLRGISNQPTNSIYLGEFHWYTTDKDVQEPLRKTNLIEHLKEMSFFEYKMNGKSKGIVFLEFSNEEYATYAKELFEKIEFDHKRVYALFTTAPNPFKHLPKESSSKPTRNIINNTANIPRLGNTPMNFAFNPSMPYFPTPPVPPNIRMYNEMMMRGGMRSNSNNRPRLGFNQSSTAAMVKFIKAGKVVVILQGRYAGKKAVVVRNHDEGTKERPYGYAVVAGVERTPLKVTKSMGKKKVAKRSKVKPFIKIVNYNHMMPTRYGLELEQIKGTISSETFKEPTQREDSKKVIKKLFEERYQTGKNKWFFSKLRF